MHISEIHVYPVKSLKGIPLQRAEVLRSGLEHDRRWMVVQPDGTFMTQRGHPQMALVETALEDGRLVLSSFGMDSHVVEEIHADSPVIHTEVWGDGVRARVHGDETNRWLSQAIGTACRLVCFPEDQVRARGVADSAPRDHTLFADAYPILVTSRASLELLNQKLAQPVGMNRFRPNLVIDGCEAHAEDDWPRLSVNGLVLRGGEPCARCSVPTVDPDTGTLAGPEPIHTLSAYRARDGEIYFGMTYIPERAGSVSVGDAVSAH